MAHVTSLSPPTPSPHRGAIHLSLTVWSRFADGVTNAGSSEVTAMKHYGPIECREPPCPDDSVSEAEQVLAALDSLHEPTMQAYAEFCEDKIEVPAALAKALILSICSGKWDALRSRIGYSNEWLDEALDEIVWSIDKQQAAFIEHHAAQLRSKAEQIKQERAA